MTIYHTESSYKIRLRGHPKMGQQKWLEIPLHLTAFARVHTHVVFEVLSKSTKLGQHKTVALYDIHISTLTCDSDALAVCSPFLAKELQGFLGCFFLS